MLAFDWVLMGTLAVPFFKRNFGQLLYYFYVFGLKEPAPLALSVFLAA